MSGEQDALVLRTLAAMPFLDWLELAAVSGLAEATAYRVLRRLKAQGLVKFLRHASRLTAATRRWHLTSPGLERLAEVEGLGVERLLRSGPFRPTGSGSCWPAWTPWPSFTGWPRRRPQWKIPSGSAGTGPIPWTPPPPFPMAGP